MVETYIMTTPVDMPTWMGEISHESPTPSSQTTGNQWMLRENQSSLWLSYLELIRSQLLNPKHMCR